MWDDGSPTPVVRRAHVRLRHRHRLHLACAAAAALGALALVAAVLVERSSSVEVAEPDPAPLAATTPVLSARRVPQLTARPAATRNARNAVAPVLATAAPDTCVSVDDGATPVVAQRDTDTFVPASNMKLLTGAAALDLLGADTKLTTRFVTSGPPSGGVVEGDLWMVGGGDPLLTTDTYAARSNNGTRPATDLEAVADQIVASGIRHVTGSVVGDGSRYDSVRVVSSWPARYLSQNVVAPLSALLVNDGWMVDPVVPGAGPGGPAPDPSQHAAAAMTALLRARGVQVDGEPRSGTAPERTHTLLEVPSLTVDEIVAELTAFSDNTTGELLLKEMGLRRAGVGSTEAGSAAVRDWASEKGLPVDGLVVADGSGLSSANRISCRLLSEILRSDGAGGPLSDGLAVPGEPGTLDKRFLDQPLRERVRAKTGTLNDVTALAGWLRTDPGTDLRFVFITNTTGRATTFADLAVQTELLRALLSYPQAPPQDQLVPRPPAPAV